MSRLFLRPLTRTFTRSYCTNTTQPKQFDLETLPPELRNIKLVPKPVIGALVASVISLTYVYGDAWYEHITASDDDD